MEKHTKIPNRRVRVIVYSQPSLMIRRDSKVTNSYLNQLFGFETKKLNVIQYIVTKSSFYQHLQRQVNKMVALNYTSKTYSNIIQNSISLIGKTYYISEYKLRRSSSTALLQTVKSSDYIRVF
jgi:hypothetical protein